MNEILQVIQTVGFPIFMVLALGWYIIRESDKHKEETKSFTDALNQNSLTLQKLHDRLESMFSKNKEE